MKHQSLHTALAALLATATALLAACSDDNGSADFVNDTATISPTLAIDPEVAPALAGQQLPTLPPAPSEGAFSLTLTAHDGDLTATWPSVDQFSTRARYATGAYTLSVSTPYVPEGPDGAMYGAAATFTLTAGEAKVVPLTARHTRAIATCTYANYAESSIDDITLAIHSDCGAAYVDMPATDLRPVYVAPGLVSAIATIDMTDGRTVRVSTPGRRMEAATCYAMAVSVAERGGNPVVEVDPGDGSEPTRIILDDALLSSSAPQVTARGFTPGTPLDVVEGSTPAAPVSMAVTPQGASAVASLRLSTLCPQLAAAGIPAEVDLYNTTADTRRALTAAGLKWTDTEIDFTGLIQNLHYDSSNQGRAAFTVVATNSLGLVSEPVTLALQVLDADLTVTGFSDAMIGVNTATATLISNATDLDRMMTVETLASDSHWQTTPITHLEETEPGHWRATFAVPDGTGRIQVRVLYRGQVKGEGTIGRRAPEFGIEADMFARTARVRITGVDNAMARTLLKYLNVYNNDRQCTIYNVDASTATVEIMGLEPSKKVRLRATVMSAPTGEADWSNTIETVTEAATDIPNGDFEDMALTARYDNLPSGGRYSQTILDIHNQQNTTTFQVYTPKGWATANAKTFCMEARNKNTWYMHPSARAVTEAHSGYYAVCLTNTAWDTDGPEIEPYTQTGTPYLSYNPFIPQIAHRAAGRLWLGSYSFNAADGSEEIVEGVAFTSRPSALNGLYKYLPGAATNQEQGIAIVKVWGTTPEGEELVIAQGETRLPVVADYTAFSVPLQYARFGVKADKITVILAASDALGSIDYESARVLTYPDPVSATSTGNRLWIDNLSFAY